MYVSASQPLAVQVRPRNERSQRAAKSRSRNATVAAAPDTHSNSRPATAEERQIEARTAYLCAHYPPSQLAWPQGDQKSRLFSPMTIAVATGVVGPAAGGALLTANLFQRSGPKTMSTALMVILLSLATATGLIAATMFVPFFAYMSPLVYIGLAAIYGTVSQSTMLADFSTRRERGIADLGVKKAIGFCILGLAMQIQIAIVVAGLPSIL